MLCSQFTLTGYNNQKDWPYAHHGLLQKLLLKQTRFPFLLLVIEAKRITISRFPMQIDWYLHVVGNPLISCSSIQP